MRYTLQECIDVFNTNPLCQYSAIRNMENLSEWKTAAKYWQIIGNKQDAAACNLIVESIELGDRYRTATKHLNDWVNENS